MTSRCYWWRVRNKPLNSDNGEILLAKGPERWSFKFVGDVRLSLCTTLDQLIGDVFSAGYPGVLEIDLTQAINIDSTCLGLLAKLAMQCEVETQSQPQLCCPHAHLIDLLESLGLESLFKWVEETQMLEAEPVPLRPCDAVSAQPLVLEAHERLAQLNTDNQAQFQGLIDSLKQ